MLSLPSVYPCSRRGTGVVQGFWFFHPTVWHSNCLVYGKFHFQLAWKGVGGLPDNRPASWVEFRPCHREDWDYLDPPLQGEGWRCVDQICECQATKETLWLTPLGSPKVNVEVPFSKQTPTKRDDAWGLFNFDMLVLREFGSKRFLGLSGPQKRTVCFCFSLFYNQKKVSTKATRPLRFPFSQEFRPLIRLDPNWFMC